MANTARKGNSKEVRSARALEADGYLVASRRHIGGAGDLLAIPKPGVIKPPLLAEVKCTRRPYDHFPPVDREALVVTAQEWMIEPVLLWWAPGATAHELLDRTAWPTTRGADEPGS